MKPKKGSGLTAPNEKISNEIQNNQESKVNTSFLSLFARLYWMIFGFILMGIAALKIHQSTNKFFYTLMLWLAVSSLILARYMDIKIFKGLTSDNSELSTMEHLKSYSIKVIIAALIISVVLFFV